MLDKDQGSYVIGIDLGTTNSSLAFARRDAGDEQPVELLDIPQWDGEGRLFRDVKLPSFTWIRPKPLQKNGSRRLPWHAPEAQVKWVVGREAKAEVLKDQGRVIHSAKSWLSVGAGSTRQSAFLPWASAAVGADEKISPVAVQSAYLEHLKESWDLAQSEPFIEQKIVITVPASFDELAQRLTLEAARQAGFPEGVQLLEEPLAAFYDYWQKAAQKTRTGVILICDVGGGTSDFSLLRVESSSTEPRMERIKVSEHILLGGDNIDLHLAHLLAQKMGPDELPRSSWALLLSQVRKLKEDVLSVTGPADEEFFVSVPLKPQLLLGGYASTSITRQELLNSIMEGFFPPVPREARPEKTAATGLRSWGLPFAEDTAITRHLAAFLGEQAIDAVLFAGGTLLPLPLQKHILMVLQSWQPHHPIEHLQQSDPDLAIARGAARYAGLKARAAAVVHSPYPQSLYVALQNKEGLEQLICLIPRGWPRETPAVLQMPGLKLRLGSEVAFRLYATADGIGDTIGGDAPLDARLRALPLVSTLLDKGAAEIPISLQAIVRETGLLQLHCRAEDGSDRTWLLDFAVEGHGEGTGDSTPAQDVKLPPRFAEAEKVLKAHFSKQGVPAGISSLPKLLEEILGPRSEWNMPTLRAIWPYLADAMFRRQKDTDGEAVWLYLAGFCLRPGFGASRDSERMQSLWRIFDQGYSKGAAEKKLEEQWYLLWRRVAGGLNRTQQNRIMDRILPSIRKIGEAGPEMIRLAASLERADASRRIQLGRTLLQQIASGNKDQLDARIWALARVSSRYPLYAGPEAVLPIALIEEWAEQLRPLSLRSRAWQKLSLFYSWAGRRRGDVLMDLDEHWRAHFIERLQEAGADPAEMEAVASPQGRDQGFLQEMFGESLPLGLVIR
ncbi:MAG TPA: Hsp70 family protein [Oligoflexus sp.]|uniref:hsp70 family protein n=1 Tax=Oligoflexus sp. TaxID=1971216 RepID=UPI002D7F345E|nr:Hsp70 family protein [Oligoflexus sp.]HET9240757.1 Hsp70 family protein [Oligoflexus sp.]